MLSLPSQPITPLGNFVLPTWYDLWKRMRIERYPKIVNPKEKRGKLQEEPYWESYAPITNFYALVADLDQLPVIAQEALRYFNQIVEPFVDDWQQKYAHLLISEYSVESHRDPPVRDLGINWYPFDTLGHSLTVGDMTVYPQQGDMFLLDVRQYHHTNQIIQDMPFFSYTIFLEKP